MVPGNARTQMKEDEIVEKYRDLKKEISKLWSVQTTAILIKIRALGTIADHLTFFLAIVEV